MPCRKNENTIGIEIMREKLEYLATIQDMGEDSILHIYIHTQTHKYIYNFFRYFEIYNIYF